MRSPSSASSKQQTSGAKGGKKTECCSKLGLKRGPWTAEEDQLLADYIKRGGEGKWRTLPSKAGLLRCGKSCRLRWMNYLRPSVKRGHITPDEEDLILRLHRLLGNRWSLIAGRIPGRTDNEIKNYWNTHLSKKLISQGIDPKTHKPLILLNPNNNNTNPPSITYNNINLNHTSFSSEPIMISTPNYSPVLASEEDGPMNVGDDDHEGITSTEEIADDDDINICCSDEAFSSFLNSLINDDMFNSNINNQLQQDDHHQQPNHSVCDHCQYWDQHSYSSTMASGACTTSEPNLPSNQAD